MRKMLKFCLLLLVMASVAACKEKKSDGIIIVHKPTTAQKQKTQKTGDMDWKRTVSWVGSQYTVSLGLKADPTLPLATDGVTDYYDNRTTLTIMRADGTKFFSRTFTKSDFKQHVDNTFYKDGALLAIIFDKVEGSSLKFAVTVGNPDKASGEFVPLELSVSNMGAVSVKESEE